MYTEVYSLYDCSLYNSFTRNDPKEMANTEEIAKEFATLAEYREAIQFPIPA